MKSLETVLKASKILEEDGIEGIQTVIKLVGLKIALSMYISSQRIMHNKGLQYPGNPDFEGQIITNLKMNNLWQINSFHGEYRFLSNFWLVDVQYKGEIYPSVEHAYIAAKTNDKEIREKIRQTLSPGQVKKTYGGMQVDEDWHNQKERIMRDLISQKFDVIDNPLLAKLLIDTGDLEIFEGNNHGDIFWGVCEGEGQNKLGKILLDQRTLCVAELENLKRDYPFSKASARKNYLEDKHLYLHTEKQLLKVSQIFEI